MNAIQEKEYQELRSFLRRLAHSENETARRLAEAIASELTSRQAQIVRMYFLEQNSVRKIASILGVYPSTVSRILAAARKKLKHCLRYGARSLLFDEDEYF